MYGYIYMTTNLVNGRKYIGQKHSSKFLGTKYLGSGKALKLAIETYGKSQFTVELLEWCSTKEELNDREIYWIAYYDAVTSRDFYNICKGGEAGPGGPMMAGKKHSEETKRRMSESRKGSKNGNYGNHRKMSDLEREHHSEAMIGSKNPMYGRHHSKETLEKLSIVHKRENLSEETRKRMSESHKGYTWSETQRQKQIERNTGKRWITNGQQDKFATVEECTKLIDLGWFYGRSHYKCKCSSETIENTTNEKDIG